MSQKDYTKIYKNKQNNILEHVVNIISNPTLRSVI